MIKEFLSLLVAIINFFVSIPDLIQQHIYSLLNLKQIKFEEPTDSFPPRPSKSESIRTIFEGLLEENQNDLTFKIDNQHGIPNLEPLEWQNWFNIRDESGNLIFRDYFHLLRYDYGVTYLDFLRYSPQSQPLSPTDPEPSILYTLGGWEANETFRCFFLHLGVALGIHPFALQIAFREMARKMVLSPPCDPSDEESANNWRIIFDDALNSLNRDVYVDCMILQAIWPVELDEYQILIINLNQRGIYTHFYHFQPPVSQFTDPMTGEWTGKDIVLTLQHGHFTLILSDPTRPEVEIKVVDKSLTTMEEKNLRLQERFNKSQNNNNNNNNNDPSISSSSSSSSSLHTSCEQRSGKRLINSLILSAQLANIPVHKSDFQTFPLQFHPQHRISLYDTLREYYYSLSSSSSSSSSSSLLSSMTIFSSPPSSSSTSSSSLFSQSLSFSKDQGDQDSPSSNLVPHITERTNPKNNDNISFHDHYNHQV